MAQIASEGGGSLWLDLCTGTGEVAENLINLAPDGTKVLAADFSEVMLKHVLTKKNLVKVPLVLSDAFELPFKDDSLDLITISLAIRNLKSDSRGLLRAFAEFHRVLKVGGRFVCLETSQPHSWIVRRIMHGYVKLLVAPMGRLITKSNEGFKYLSSSMLSFYDADQLASILANAGFSSVFVTRLCLGTAAIHKSKK